MKRILVLALGACLLTRTAVAAPALECDVTFVDKKAFTLTFELTPDADGLVAASTGMHGVIRPLGRYKMEATAAAYRFDTGTDIHDMILVNRTTGAVQIVTKTAWVDGPARHMADGVCRAIDIQPKL